MLLYRTWPTGGLRGRQAYGRACRLVRSMDPGPPAASPGNPPIVIGSIPGPIISPGLPLLVKV